MILFGFNHIYTEYNNNNNNRIYTTLSSTRIDISEAQSADADIFAAALVVSLVSVGCQVDIPQPPGVLCFVVFFVCFFLAVFFVVFVVVFF